MSFGEDGARLKADAVPREEVAPVRLASAEPGPLTAWSTTGTDLGLADGPIRTKASGMRTTSSEANEKSKLDDAEAVGKLHSGWFAGAASNDCVAAWQRHLHGLGELVEDAAAALTTAMDSQIGEDVSLAQRLRAQADWLEDA
ncbi:hypothetical protein OG242_20075 [Streptomyces sp. NBC_00727]|uniref:hypothetical protein n=1 Tax=Streptomyces sp. NBC_00727 TaxID=2903675 RepID=UPI00386D0FC3